MLIACPSCQRQLNVPDNAVGKQVRCPAPDCGTVFYVPAGAAPTPAAPARPATPAKPKVKPAPAAPSPAAAPSAGAPFDFGGGGAVAGPEADFGFTDHTDGGLRGIGVRTRISRAAGWLNMAAGSMVLLTLVSIALNVTQAVMARALVMVAVFACVPTLGLVFPIVILIGARMFARGRRYGLAMTAAIMSLAIGALALLGTLGCGVVSGMQAFGVGVAAVHGPGAQFMLISSCTNSVLLAVVTFCSLYGGFVALRTLMHAEVKAAFT